MATAASDNLERKYSEAFSFTIKDKPVPSYTAPTTAIDAVFGDLLSAVFPSTQWPTYFRSPTYDSADIPVVYSNPNAASTTVGDVTTAGNPNEFYYLLTPDASVKDTYNWAQMPLWNATLGGLRVPALFNVGKKKRKSCGAG